MALHEFLGEALAGLELCGRAGWAEDGPATALKLVDHAQGEWKFRTNHREIRLQVGRE